MSNYIRGTKNPDTHEFEEAEWLDNYYGPHHYAVSFPSGNLYKADDWKWEFEDNTPLQEPQRDKDGLKKTLLEYTDYEEALMEAQVADGGPRPIAAQFSFARFYNWLNDLEQPLGT
jgi:hypothetical protein